MLIRVGQMGGYQHTFVEQWDHGICSTNLDWKGNIMQQREHTMEVLALVVVLSFCAFAVYVGIWPIPEKNTGFINICLGALVAQFANILSYYFGSSRSAEKKVPPTEEPKK